MKESLEKAAAHISAGQPLAAGDIAVLAEASDILTLGMLADEARRRRHGRDTTFVRVADVQVPLGDGPVTGIPPAAREVRVNGRADSFDVLLSHLCRVVEAAGGVPVSAFSLEALEAKAAVSGRRLADLLAAVRDTGVARVADAALDQLQHAEMSLEQVRKAGLGLARLTVQHTASTTARLEHIVRARSLQQSLGWIENFAPLGRLSKPGSPSTGYDDVRQVALARLLIDNIASVQVDWAWHGPKLAQVALLVGADDVDGVSPLDDTGEGRRRSPLEEIRRNILAAGLVPIERDGARRRVAS
jgi:aminodeoxyfutalosine synthase